MNADYATTEPTRADVDAMRGPVLIEFGSPTCGHCRAAQPLLAQALRSASALPHLKIADGPGRPLGRSFRVKLWPTLIFMRDGLEVSRLVRPQASEPIEAALRGVVAAG